MNVSNNLHVEDNLNTGLKSVKRFLHIEKHIQSLQGIS